MLTAASLSRAPGIATRRATVRPATVVAYLAAILIVGITVVPLLFVLIGGFRTTAQVNAAPVGWPSPWVADNYTAILGAPAFWEFLWNSMVIAVIATGLAVALGSMAGFALSRYRFRGREALYGVFTIGLLFPLGVASLPLYLLLRQVGLLENPLGVALPEAAFSLPVTILILRPFMLAIPQEVEDAAVLDGASRLGFFWRILLPLSRPALVTVGVLAFVASWNSFLLPLLVLQDDSLHTLPLGVQNFSAQYSQDTAGILAFTSLAMMPALLFFTLAERQIVGGIQGAVKG